MSFATDRAALVELLAGIEGIVALPDPSPVPAQGQAWPLLGGLAFDPYPTASWRAVFVAGGDGRIAELWLDANLDAIRAGLRPFMYVDTVTPIDLGNGLFGIEFAGRKEF